MEVVAPRPTRDVDGDLAPAGSPSWRVPLIWRVLQDVGRVLVSVICRFQVTGEVAPHLRAGPLILAANHISNFDPICMTAGSRSRGVSPRIMATGGLFRPPVVGWVMTRSGHIPVDRGQATVAHAVPTAMSALREGAPVCIYPEGRIGLDPGLWPERAKTGLARLALATRAPVIPVAIWGSHEVMAYHGSFAMFRTVVSSIWRRPTVRMSFGVPVDLSDLREGRVGDAQRATDRIMAALTAELATLRPDQPGVPRFIDPTKPVSSARSYRTRPPTVRLTVSAAGPQEGTAALDRTTPRVGTVGRSPADEVSRASGP